MTATTFTPPTLPLDELIELLPGLRGDPAAVLDGLVASYGPIVRIAVEGTPIDLLVVNEPELVREILLDRDDVLGKGPALQVARVLLGDGLLTSEGHDHARKRRLVAPAFHRPRLVGYTATMAEIAGVHVRYWPTGAQIDIHGCFVALMLDILGRTLFGMELARQAPEIRQALDDVLAQFASQTPFGQFAGAEVSSDQMGRVREATRSLQDLVLGLVAERRTEPAGRNDLLTNLVTARDDEGDGRGLTDQEVHDEVMTLLLAGHETTANALSWATHLLSTHPFVAAACATEVAGVIGDRPVAYDDLERLPYLRAVLDETLRLYPPAWALTRQATRPVQVGPYEVPAGAQVLVSPWLLHRDERFWSDPTAFQPERWLDGSGADRPPFAFAPFGGGGRSCIGEHFARIEATVVLAELVRRYEIDPVADRTVEREHSITLRPRDGVDVVLRPR